MWFINSFHIQILAIELMFCLRLERKDHFWLRILPMAAAYIALPQLVPGSFFSPFVTIGWFTFGFLVMAFLSGIVIGLCFRMNARQVIFYCCVAHTLQHMVHCLYRITGLLLDAPSGAVSVELAQVVYLLLTCIVVHRLLRDRFRGSETVDFQNSYLLIFAVVSSLTIYVVSYWTTFWEGETIGIHFFDCFSCLLLLFILLDIFRIRKAEREQIIMERLLRQEQETHQISRATVDVINRKCHDLRHQIAALRHMSDDEKEKSISELENAVLIYDSFPKSGNEDLDVILAEKSLLAEKQHISVRCIVDGGKLSFMKLEDLYSLMGNALDNAIEAAGQEEETKRMILLYAAAKGSFFSIHVENPCSRKPLFMDGLPVTNKPDTDYHGYGMRSMRYLCEKYGGALTTGWEDGIFSLDILFPMNT